MRNSSRGDRPGVGQNLHNHPFFSITCHVRPEGRQHRFGQSVSRSDDCPLLLSSAGLREHRHGHQSVERLPGPLADDPLGRQMAQLMVLLNKSRSKGQVSLDESNPLGPRVSPATS